MVADFKFVQRKEQGHCEKAVEYIIMYRQIYAKEV